MIKKLGGVGSWSVILISQNLLRCFSSGLTKTYHLVGAWEESTMFISTLAIDKRPVQACPLYD